MFVQVIEGTTTEEAALRQLLDRWDAEVKPATTGFLGTTGGVSDDGTVFLFVRFVDEASAVANRRRPGQEAWWQQLMELFEHPPTLSESSDVVLLLAGGSDDADFVQVIKATSPDRSKVDELMTPDRIAAVQRSRPDLIGSIRVWLADGAFIEAAYFTNEADARDAEQSGDYEDAEAPFVEAYGPMTFVDLPAPIFQSP